MPRAQWPLAGGRPVIQIVLTQATTKQPVPQTLLADTGAGAAGVSFSLILREDHCRQCGGVLVASVRLGRAYAGLFPTFSLRVQVAPLGFDRFVRVVGVPSGPRGLDGVACFRFLNRFTYGNFGDPGSFGLES